MCIRRLDSGKLSMALFDQRVNLLVHFNLECLAKQFQGALAKT